MFRKMLLFSMVVSSVVGAMNPVYDQKAFNRRARGYAESVLEGREISRESLIASLQFLPEDVAESHANLMLTDDDVFSEICERASAIDKLEVFTSTCRSVFSGTGDNLQRIQISMLLNAVFGMMPKDMLACSGLKKLMSLSVSLPMPLD